MPRPPSLTPALTAVATLGLVAALLGLPVPGTPADAAPGTTPYAVPARATESLRLEIQTLTPTVLTGPEDVEISGTITNETDETWTTVNVQSFVSNAPITDAAGLAEAADMPVEDEVGDRLTEVGTFTSLPSLAPGESAPFTALVPQAEFAAGDGVYWVGVHALGEVEGEPRDTVADGRARTFMPVLPEGGRPLPAAMVLPLRAPVHHTAEGRIAQAGAWGRILGPGGRLYNLLQAGRQAGSRPITWLVDPAVPHAASLLAAGNPPTSVEPLRPADQEGGAAGSGEPPDDSPVPTPIPEPTDLDSEDDGGGDGGDGPGEGLTPAEKAVAASAQAWLAMFREEMAAHPVLALPYGDVDASALEAERPDLLARAREHSLEVMTAFGVTATPVLAPPEGHLSPEAVATAGTATLLLLSEQAIDPAVAGVDPATGLPTRVPSTGQIMGHTFATTSAGVADGGPGPEPAAGPIAVRQRVVSEAALQLLADDRSPLIVSPPASWDPAAGSADLYSTFDEGLLRLRPLGDLVAGNLLPTGAGPGGAAGDGSLPDEALVYTDEHRAAELPATNVRAAALLVAQGQLLAGVLTRPSRLVPHVTEIALTDVSYFARRRPLAYRARTLRSTEAVEGLLGSISIDGPPSVTLSSDVGTIGLSISNELEVPVMVHVEADDGGELSVEVLDNPVELAPNSRRRVRLEATAARQGIETVTVQVTDSEGTPLGSSASFPVRTAQISGILWVIMGGGALMLFGAIAVRLFRRVRAARGSEE